MKKISKKDTKNFSEKICKKLNYSDVAVANMQKEMSTIKIILWTCLFASVLIFYTWFIGINWFIIAILTVFLTPLYIFKILMPPVEYRVSLNIHKKTLALYQFITPKLSNNRNFWVLLNEIDNNSSLYSEDQLDNLHYLSETNPNFESLLLSENETLLKLIDDYKQFGMKQFVDLLVSYENIGDENIFLEFLNQQVNNFTATLNSYNEKKRSMKSYNTFLTVALILPFFISLVLPSELYNIASQTITMQVMMTVLVVCFFLSYKNAVKRLCYREV